MNGIDAIISICALTAGIALLLGAVGESQKASAEAMDSVKAKTISLECAGIIDSMSANSATAYKSEISCAPEGKIVKATQSNKIKSTGIICNARKNPIFEVDAEKHYLE